MTLARRVFALVACMVLLASFRAVAQAVRPSESLQGTADTHAPARFDIDEQPLASALRAFGEQSGTAVLFDDALVAGRVSHGVHGTASAPEALRILLLGTGLGARFSSTNAFTVTADATTPASGLPDVPAMARDGSPSLGEDDASLIQVAVAQALCTAPDTRPGTFRLAVQLWVDGSGDVDRASALAPSDDPARDRRVLAALRSVHLPPRLSGAGPVTVLLVPSAASNDPCRGSRAGEG
jgi:hypothetical protein